MARKVGHAIHDILEAIERVDEVTRGKTFEEFESSWQLRWLVQRALEIISEASAQFRVTWQVCDPKFPGRVWPGLETSSAMSTAVCRIALSGMSSLTNCRA